MDKQIKESPLFWPARYKDGTMRVLDETLIPNKIHYIALNNEKQAFKVIKDMKTRAFGQFLVVLNTFLLIIDNAKRVSDTELLKKIKTGAEMLNKSRPTFPFAEVTSIIVGWAQEAIKQSAPLRPYVIKHIDGYLKGIRYQRLDRVKRIAALIEDGDSILTHCNVSGELAMAAALCKEQKKDIHIFATETRPYFQGAKLTVWEMKRLGVPVTLVADNAAGSVMADGLVNKVIVGSDRSCANGDFANKIGTYQIAVLAQEFGIPFYVLTQPSNKIKRGKDIPIEMRDAKELMIYEGRKTLKGKLTGLYPGFDVIGHELVGEAVAINAR